MNATNTPAQGEKPKGPPIFKLVSTSKYGTGYYARDGFRPKLAIPNAHFKDSKLPATITMEFPGTYATKAPKQTVTGVAKAMEGLTPEARKEIRKAGREAEKKALLAAGVEL